MASAEYNLSCDNILIRKFKENITREIFNTFDR